MQRQQFETSLSLDAPPTDLSLELTALWWLKNSNWQAAHDLIDAAPGLTAAWVHALLHRMEGDQWNADYWYARAGKARPNLTIGQELEAMLDELLEQEV
ncbi:MAG: hypothetical protein AAF597_01420 [Bacteroidota bacterium]